MTTQKTHIGANRNSLQTFYSWTVHNETSNNATSKTKQEHQLNEHT